MVTVEICLEDIESAIAAQQGGANRIELCDNLTVGGTTPSIGLISQTRKQLEIELQVIIRPRGGNFCYSDIEFNVMKEDIEAAKSVGVDGIVTGILNTDGTIDTIMLSHTYNQAQIDWFKAGSALNLISKQNNLGLVLES